MHKNNEDTIFRKYVYVIKSQIQKNYKPIFIKIVTDVRNERKMGSEETDFKVIFELHFLRLFVMKLYYFYYYY